MPPHSDVPNGYIRSELWRLSKIATHVMLVLLSFRNHKTGLCCPSERLIASVLHTNEAQVRRGIRELQQYNLLEVKRGRPNRYIFTPTFFNLIPQEPRDKDE